MPRCSSSIRNWRLNREDASGLHDGRVGAAHVVHFHADRMTETAPTRILISRRHVHGRLFDLGSVNGNAAMIAVILRPAFGLHVLGGRVHVD
jgi:hypothetical protein